MIEQKLAERFLRDVECGALKLTCGSHSDLYSGTHTHYSLEEIGGRLGGKRLRLRIIGNTGHFDFYISRRNWNALVGAKVKVDTLDESEIVRKLL